LINLEELISKLILVHYVPGGFGSTVYHLINMAQESVNYDKNNDNTQIFQWDGSAHGKIFKVIKNFHSDDEIIHWLELNYNEKKQYILKNINPDFVLDNMYQPVIRIANYEGIEKIRDFFQNSKYIFITFEKESIPLLAMIWNDKISYKSAFELNKKKNVLLSKTDKDIRKHKILQSMHQDVISYYYNQQENIKYKDGDIILKFENFFEKNTFIKQTCEIYNKLNFTANFNDIENFYNMFYTANKKYFKIWEKFYEQRL